MASRLRICVLATLSILTLTFTFRLGTIEWFPRDIQTERFRPRFKHEAVQILQNRDVSDSHSKSPSELRPAPSRLITIVTPSPGAKPISVYQQSVAVTSYVPIYTLCPYTAASIFGPPYANTSQASPAANPTTTRQLDTKACVTEYSSTVTPICYSVLQGLVTQITVSKCDQRVTFSSEYGFELDQPTVTIPGVGVATASPYVRTLTTYYVANWNELTKARVPEHVEVRVCFKNADGIRVCVERVEVWRIETTTVTLTTSQHIEFTATVSGPSAMLIGTHRTDLSGDMAVIAVTTDVISKYQLQTVMTIRSNLTSGGESTSTRTVVVATTNITRKVMFNPALTVWSTSPPWADPELDQVRLVFAATLVADMHPHGA